MHIKVLFHSFHSFIYLCASSGHIYNLSAPFLQFSIFHFFLLFPFLVFLSSFLVFLVIYYLRLKDCQCLPSSWQTTPRSSTCWAHVPEGGAKKPSFLQARRVLSTPEHCTHDMATRPVAPGALKYTVNRNIHHLVASTCLCTCAHTHTQSHTHTHARTLAHTLTYARRRTHRWNLHEGPEKIHTYTRKDKLCMIGQKKIHI